MQRLRRSSGDPWRDVGGPEGAELGLGPSFRASSVLTQGRSSTADDALLSGGRDCAIATRRRLRGAVSGRRGDVGREVRMVLSPVPTPGEWNASQIAHGTTG